MIAKKELINNVQIEFRSNKIKEEFVQYYLGDFDHEKIKLQSLTVQDGMKPAQNIRLLLFILFCKVSDEPKAYFKRIK